jgi:hypothetical protein
MDRARWLLITSFLVACSGGSSESTSPSPEGPPEPTAPEAPPAPTEIPTTPTSGATGSSVVSRAPVAATGCPATDPNALAQPGTVHSSSVAANELLDLAGSPHRFPDGASIDAATLSIEPCTLVLVGQNQAIWSNNQATLLAQGTADRPIVIRAIDPVAARGAWGGLYFGNGATSTSRLSYLTVQNAGADVGWGERGAIWVDGATTVVMNEVTIRQSGGHGVSMRGTARFGTGSAGLHVIDSGNADIAAALVAFADTNAVGSLPELTQEGNDTAEIALIGESTRVTTTQTWRNPGSGIRYRLRNDLEVRGPSGPVLTVAPGATVALDEGHAIYVGWDEDGGLVLDGGAEETRVVLTSARREPAPGDWVGIYFGDHVLRTSSRIAWTTISYAGAPPGWGAEHDCGQGAGASFAIQIRDRDLGPVITHTRFTFLPEACVAIQRAFISDAPTDYTAAAAANDFGNMGARCAQSFVEPTTGCPDPVPTCP